MRKRLTLLAGLVCFFYLTACVIQWLFDIAGLPYKLSAASGTGQILFYLLALGCIALHVKFVWRKPIGEFIRCYLQGWKKSCAAFVFSAAVTSITVVLWYAAVLGAGLADWSWTPAQNFGLTPLLQLLIAWLIAIVLAITEELIFRGFVFRYLRVSNKAASVARAIIFSALVFALSHRFRDLSAWLRLENLALLAALTVLGSVLALAYNYSRSLSCSIGIHAALVWAAIFYRKMPFYHLPHPAWWAGTPADPRTAPQTIMLFVLLLVLFWQMRHWLERKFALEDFNQADDSAL